MHRVSRTLNTLHFHNFPDCKLRPQTQKSDKASVSSQMSTKKSTQMNNISPRKPVRSLEALQRFGLGIQNLTKRQEQPKAYAVCESLEFSKNLPYEHGVDRGNTTEKDPDSFRAQVARDAQEVMEWHASITTIDTCDETVTDASMTDIDGFTTFPLTGESSDGPSPNDHELVIKGMRWCRSNTSKSRSHLELNIIPRQELETQRCHAVNPRRLRRRVKTSGRSRSKRNVLS